ncbi:MAG: CPBP family intramembrane metalloprotease [Oscillospiraceae bacterium]|nr:CPBP family intramembrane metalloprotease [Oscillospiraceae bacterium]
MKNIEEKLRIEKNIRLLSNKIGYALLFNLGLTFLFDLSLMISLKAFLLIFSAIILQIVFVLISKKNQKAAVFFYIYFYLFVCGCNLFLKFSIFFAVSQSASFFILIAATFFSLKVNEKFLPIIAFSSFLLTAIYTSNIFKNGLFLALHNYKNFTSNGSNLVVYYIVTALVSLTTMTLPFLELLPKSKTKISSVLCFKPVKLKMLFSMVSVGLLVCYFANQSASFFVKNLELIGIKNQQIKGLPLDSSQPESVFLYVIIISFLPAVLEEFAFRGLILGSLRKFGDFFAVLVSSILFGIIHLNTVQSPFAFLAGLILGVLLIETNSMLPGIILHFVNNFFSSVMDVFEKLYDERTVFILGSVIWLIFLVLGVLSFKYITKVKPDFLDVSKNLSRTMPINQCLKVFMKSKGMIVAFIVISVLFVMFNKNSA